VSTPRGYYRIGGRHTAPSPLLFHHEVVRGDSSHGEGSLQTSPLVEGPPLSGEEVFVSWRGDSPHHSPVTPQSWVGFCLMERRGTGVAAPPGSPDDHGSSGVPLLGPRTIHDRPGFPSSPWPHHPPQSCAIVPSREVVENIWKPRGVLTCPRDPLSPSPSPTTGEGDAGWCPGDLDMG